MKNTLIRNYAIRAFVSLAIIPFGMAEDDLPTNFSPEQVRRLEVLMSPEATVDSKLRNDILAIARVHFATRTWGPPNDPTLLADGIYAQVMLRFFESESGLKYKPGPLLTLKEAALEKESPMQKYLSAVEKVLSTKTGVSKFAWNVNALYFPEEENQSLETIPKLKTVPGGRNGGGKPSPEKSGQNSFHLPTWAWVVTGVAVLGILFLLIRPRKGDGS